jgi:hypothetical protein
MPNARGQTLIDSFQLPGYDVPDAVPAQLTNEGQTAVVSYKIPLVIWMFFFLIVGYVGLRMILDD